MPTKITKRTLRRQASVLADEVADEELRTVGYTVVRLLSAADAGRVVDLYGEIHGPGGTGFEPDLTNPDSAYRERVAAELSQRLGDRVSSLFADHEPFLWNFLCKWPGDPADLYLHRDWMFVDERRDRRSYLVWIALDDIDGDNGMLQVLPGSHRISGELAGSGLEPAWLQHASVVRPRLVTIPVRAGCAVVFDHALAHCSHRNQTRKPRVAVGSAVHRTSDGLLHFRRTGRDSAERFDVDPSFFVEYTPERLLESAPLLPVAERVTAPGPHLDAEQLARRLDTGQPGNRPGLLSRACGARLRGTDPHDTSRPEVDLGPIDRGSTEPPVGDASAVTVDRFDPVPPPTATEQHQRTGRRVDCHVSEPIEEGVRSLTAAPGLADRGGFLPHEIEHRERPALVGSLEYHEVAQMVSDPGRAHQVAHGATPEDLVELVAGMSAQASRSRLETAHLAGVVEAALLLRRHQRPPSGGRIERLGEALVWVEAERFPVQRAAAVGIVEERGPIGALLADVADRHADDRADHRGSPARHLTVQAVQGARDLLLREQGVDRHAVTLTRYQFIE